MGTNLLIVETYAANAFTIALAVAVLLMIASVVIYAGLYAAGREALPDEARLGRLRKHHDWVHWSAWLAANCAMAAFFFMIAVDTIRH